MSESLSPTVGALDYAPLLHMLGLDADHREPWRNHYVSGSGHHAEPALDALVAAGLVEEVRRPGFLPDGDRVHMATEAGKRVAIAENLRRNPPPKPAKARYLRWLSLHEVCPDLTFREFLNRKLYREDVLREWCR